MRIRKTVGIDLGATNSAIAVLDPTDSAILAGQSEQGHLLLPSVDASARILSGLRPLLGRALNDNRYVLDTAVITIPVNFDREQIEASRQAGELAGYEVVELLPEPIAAVLYYSWLDNNHGDATYLVYHLGGAGFDVSIVRRRQGDFEVLSACGAARSAPLVSRLDLTIECCQEALAGAREKANLRLSDIDHVILVGNSRRMPGVREIVRDAFCNPARPEHVRQTEPLMHEPELCVAYGAALRGATYGTRFLGLPGNLELHLTGCLASDSQAIGAVPVAHQFAGTVRGAGASAVQDGGSIRTRSLATGLTTEAFLDVRGAFVQEVELLPESDNAFELAICDSFGREVAQVPACVRHRQGSRRQVAEVQPAPPIARALQLEPSWPRFTQLVRQALDLAATLARKTGRDVQELVDSIHAQDRYAEQAHAARNQALYRECFDNLERYAGFLEQLLQDALPQQVSRDPARPAEDEARELLASFRSGLAEVWKTARARGLRSLDERLSQVARQAQGLGQRARSDPHGVLREARRLFAELARIEAQISVRSEHASEAPDGPLERS